MSSSPRSQPRTPSKRAIAVEKQNRIGTPLPNGTTSEKSNGIVAAALQNYEKPEDFIQVPSTGILVDEDIASRGSRSQVVDGHLPSAQPQANGHHDETVEGENKLNVSELPPFDWEDFQRRYQEEMQKLNADEDVLMEDVEKLAEAFSFWAQTGANRDNMRAAKRIRTRERYVNLAEEALEEKQRRYVQVVGAFRQALEMLRGNGL